MRLFPLGEIVRDEWMRSIQIRKEIQLFEDEFVIMPNHQHAIVWMIDPTVGAHAMRPDYPLSNPDYPPLYKTTTATASHPGDIHHIDKTGATGEGGRRPPQPVKVPKSLGSLIAGFKASVTSRAKRELNMTNIWQRNYYEHIARNEAEIKGFWAYIENNPLKWEEDQLHSPALPNKNNQE